MESQDHHKAEELEKNKKQWVFDFTHERKREREELDGREGGEGDTKRLRERDRQRERERERERARRREQALVVVFGCEWVCDLPNEKKSHLGYNPQSAL